MGSSLLRFAMVFTAASIAIPFLVMAIERLLNISVSSAGTSMIPFMVAASIEGQNYVKQFGDVPSKAEMWFAARIMALIGMGLSLILGAVSLYLFPETREILAILPTVALLIIVVVLYIIAFLICRAFIGIGARAELKKRVGRR